ncbi:MAG: hypothetical protein ABSB69_17660 [Solirubrobacteraceae bacterium]|jgi:hypothetical protein
MKAASLIVSVVAVSVAALSFIVAQVAAARARKGETIRNLLGEKETVAFGALKLLRDGLPRDAKERRLVIAGVIQACVFSGSDRARALLYRVVETNPKRHAEFEAALTDLETTFTSMGRYGFTTEQLDLQRGERRVAVVRAVLNYHSPRAQESV